MFIALLISDLFFGQDLHETKPAIVNEGGAHETPSLR